MTFTLFRSRVSCLFAIFLGLFAAAAQASVVTVESGGKLMGATGVVVNGLTYNVSFVDGVCALLFSGCSQSGDFAFQTVDDAGAASNALLASVFLDLGVGREFDTIPGLTNGCETGSASCSIYTPYADGGSDVRVAVAFNLLTSDQVLLARSVSAFNSTANDAGGTWAIWSVAPTATVPEPSSLALIGFAAALLGWSQRRRQSGRSAK